MPFFWRTMYDAYYHAWRVSNEVGLSFLSEPLFQATDFQNVQSGCLFRKVTHLQLQIIDQSSAPFFPSLPDFNILYISWKFTGSGAPVRAPWFPIHAFLINTVRSYVHLWGLPWPRGSSFPGTSPGWGHCVVFLSKSKTHYVQSASLHSGVYLSALVTLRGTSFLSGLGGRNTLSRLILQKPG